MQDRRPRIDVDQTFQAAVRLDYERKFDDAEKLYQTVLAQQPDHHDSLFRLGFLRFQAGRIDDAAHLFGRAVVAKPDSADALGWLGVSLAALDRHDEALTHYHNALSINPEHPIVRNALGNELHRRGQIDQAIIHFERAIAIAPNFVSPRFTLAYILQGRGRAGEAIMHYEKILALQPDNFQAHNNIGTVFLNLGRVEDARQAYERALVLAPSEAQFHYNLATVKRFTAGDPHLEALEKLAEDMAIFDTKNKIMLHFALGKAFCDLGLKERSFRNFQQGNALKRAQLAYDEKEMLCMFERVREVFTAELMQQKSGGGCQSDTPVFVVGMPRSGTTLVEQILASHSKIYGAGEIDAFLQAILRFRSRNDSAIDFLDLVPAMSSDALREIGTDYVGLIKPAAVAAERIVNKWLLNFRYIGLIHLTLPHARIVHIRRDPIDTCFSCFSTSFAADLPFASDLGELGRYYRGYESLMEHWRRVLPRGVMIEVQYEELVADIEGQARAIVGHCRLHWEDTCLGFHRTQRQVMTASAAQVRKPLYRTSVGRGRQYESFLQPLIEALNEPDSGAIKASA
jgi:tetratricopeptide (TPR) repeat protein